MGLLEDCRTYFGSDNLYEVLSISQDASESEVKKAYKRLSLLVHPDRVAQSEKEIATQKFQVLSKIHYILSDSEKRAVYNDTGEVDDEDDISEDRDWVDYWRLLFPKLKMKDISDFMSKYKGSGEEKQDLKKYYLQFDGDMNKIAEYFISYNYTDEDRYHTIIDEMIASKEVPNLAKFTKESSGKKRARHRKFEKEASLACETLEEMSAKESDLALAIRSRANDRFEDMISQLENKYAKKPQSGTKRKK